MIRTDYNFPSRSSGLLLLLLLFLLAFPPSLSAQTDVSYHRGTTQLEDILPPSPEAASRVKYADVPFTHSMGAAEYSVPIYELKCRRLTIPISLDYCSNGIKLDEIAGVAGLGWTLNAGGCITREVVYMPDEFTEGTFSYTWPDSQLQAQLLAHTSNTATQTFLGKVAGNQIDTNADRYSYSVLGLKGQFILDPSGNVIQLQGDGVEIDYTTSDGEKTFIITGPDGTVYTFGCRETATRKEQIRSDSIYGDQSVDWSATTAWYLTQVTSRDGTESATFTYDDGGTWDRSTQTVSRTLSLTPSANTSGYDEAVSSDIHAVKSEHQTKILSGIFLSGFTAAFTYASVSSYSLHEVVSGTDADNYPRRLTAVTVTGPSGAQLVRAETATSAHAHDGRILLSGINLYRSGTLDDRWTFSYRTALHAVSRYSQDWFGYFNGENGDKIFSRFNDPDAGRTNLCPYLLQSGPNYTASLSYGSPESTQASYMMLTEADHDGARTVWTYEGGSTGLTTAVGGATVPINVGVRVARIQVYDGNTLTRVRTFTYGSPAMTTPVDPLQEVYIRTSAHIVSSGGPTLPGTSTAWTFTLSETPVTDGQALQSARLWYGTVTEEVSADGSASGNKTVYTYDTAPVHNLTYNTLDRFPTTWESAYETTGTGIAPFSGVQSQYVYDGAAQAPCLTGRATYRRDPDASAGTAELVEKEETVHTAFPTGSVMTGYRVLRVMQRLMSGPVYEQDFLHYPLYSQSSLGSMPSAVTRIGYHLSGNDTTRFTYSVSRPSISAPLRTTGVVVMSADAARGLTMTYPDMMSTTPAWAQDLVSAHALAEPVIRTYSVFTDPASLRNASGYLEALVRGTPNRPQYPDAIQAVRVETEYGYFSGALMPERTVEYVNGTESWREEILARDALGNPASVKQKGRPVTSILWSYNGLYPVAVAEGAALSSVVGAMGGQAYVNTLTQSASLSSSQLNKLNSLRAASQTASSLVTTLTHLPGVGLLSRTDPAGIKTSYTYDHGGRLASVVNTQGQTTDEYAYSLLNSGDGRLSATHYTYTSTGKGSSYRDVTWWNTLGLRLEDVAVSASGTDNADLVTAYESDYMLHDDVRIWQPYPASSGAAGSFRSGAPSAAGTYHDSPSAYHGRTYEESSRERILQRTLPGYAAHPDESYTDIVSGFPVLRWNDGAVQNSGTYPSGHLVAEITEDADGRITRSVKDHHGRLLATRREGSGSTWEAATRYVYDGLDRLSAVAGAGIALSDTLSLWRYGYDAVGRLSSKGVPGSVREYYTYDSEDRIVTLSRGDELTEIVYDDFGRVTEKYLTVGGGPRTQTEWHRYDTYSTAGAALLGGSTYTGGPAKGLETERSHAVTDGQGGFSGTAVTVTAYDALGRPVRSVTQYPDGHTNTTVTAYDFSGRPTSTVVTGLRPGGTTADVLSVTTAYDQRERPVSTLSVLTVGGVEKARNTTLYTYDALGRQSSVSSGPTASGGLLDAEYAYTLQDWTASVTASLGGRTVFSEELGYDGTPASSLGGPSYTGLITRREETWLVPTGPSQSQSVSRTEDYVYDYAGRLSAWDDASSGEDLSYDARGNITQRVPRHGSGGTVTQTYAGDRLATRKVGSAAAVSFSHDGFARMTADTESGLEIAYNPFNLPESISQGSTLKVRYTYLADGTKESALDATGAGLLYRGPFTYRRTSAGAISLESAPFDRGRLTEDGVRYHITDHLGSIRAVIDGNASTATYPPAGFYALDDFQPYGVRTASAASSYLTLASTGSVVSLRNAFTGQEDQAPDFGIPYTDFGARHYSPALSRWLVPDPLGEKYYDISPYAYCAGNPVMFIDPTGMEFTESAWKQVNRLIEEINNRLAQNTDYIANIQTRINKGTLSERKVLRLQSRIKKISSNTEELETVRREIATLALSDQIYDIRTDNSMSIEGPIFGIGEYRSGAVFNFNNGIFEILLGDNSLASLAHELKHAYQFETGDFSSGFMMNGTPFYDKEDELSAYTRGTLFGGPRVFSLPAIYDNLQNGPMDATKLAPILLNNPSALQNLSERTKSAFRINGRTYRMQMDN